jgi:hypothetical protein
MKNPRKIPLTLTSVAIAIAAGASGAAFSAEIRVMCYQDGNECDVTKDLAKRFEAENKDFTVVVDTVPYKAITEQLPVQLGAGEGPDIARVTDLGGLNRFYLDITPHVKDAKYWEANFGKSLAWLRASPTDKGIYGLQSQLTITGPFVNKTLFDQAKVPMPGPKATWDEWVTATKAVRKATQTPFAMAWDRSGHRFAGPAISYGAEALRCEGRAGDRRRLQGHLEEVRRLEQGRHDAEGSVGRHRRLVVSRRVRGVQERPHRDVSVGLVADPPDGKPDRQELRMDRRAESVRARGLHRHPGRRRVRRAQAHQVAEGSRALPRFPRAGCGVLRDDGEDREPAGACAVSRRRASPTTWARRRSWH